MQACLSGGMTRCTWDHVGILASLTLKYCDKPWPKQVNGQEQATNTPDDGEPQDHKKFVSNDARHVGSKSGSEPCETVLNEKQLL